MPVAERQDNKIVLHHEFREKERIDLIPGVRWANKEKLWKLPLSWAGCCQLRGVFGDELHVGPELDAWARNEIATRILPCMELRTAEDAPALAGGLFGNLLPFQRAGVAFMATAGSALNADEMGLGKTVQGIGVLEALGDSAYPALVVCPNSMKLPWQEEYGKNGELIGGFKKWAPGRRTSVVTGSLAKRREAIARVAAGEADVAIINWEGLKSFSALAYFYGIALTDKEKEEKELNAIPWKTIIADEVHRAKDPHTMQTRALWYIGDRAEHCYALSGTPADEALENTWAIMRFLAPAEYPASGKFFNRYGQKSFDVFGYEKIVGLLGETSQELFSFLDPRMIRRTKKAVLSQLPEKVYTTREVEVTGKQRTAYDSLRKEMLAELDSGTLIALDPLSKLTRLLQFASAHGDIDADGNLILTEPSCKVEALEEVVQELGGEQAVVFAESRQLIEIAHAKLVKLGYSVGMVTGMVSEMDRADNVRRFQAGELKLLLVTLGAGGEGLTLTAAQTAIFLQRSWSSIKNLQAEDRVHRIGQEGSVTIVDIVAVDTVEQGVQAVREAKAEKLEEILRDGAMLKTWLSKGGKAK
jgi:SNF2 family DNA or RNA helicase